MPTCDEQLPAIEYSRDPSTRLYGVPEEYGFPPKPQSQETCNQPPGSRCARLDRGHDVCGIWWWAMTTDSLRGQRPLICVLVLWWCGVLRTALAFKLPFLCYATILSLHTPPSLTPFRPDLEPLLSRDRHAECHLTGCADCHSRVIKYAKTCHTLACRGKRDQQSHEREYYLAFARHSGHLASGGVTNATCNRTCTAVYIHRIY